MFQTTVPTWYSVCPNRSFAWGWVAVPIHPACDLRATVCTQRATHCSGHCKHPALNKIRCTIMSCTNNMPVLLVCTPLVTKFCREGHKTHMHHGKTKHRIQHRCSANLLNVCAIAGVEQCPAQSTSIPLENTGMRPWCTCAVIALLGSNSPSTFQVLSSPSGLKRSALTSCVSTKGKLPGMTPDGQIRPHSASIPTITQHHFEQNFLDTGCWHCARRGCCQVKLQVQTPHITRPAPSYFNIPAMCSAMLYAAPPEPTIL